MVIDGSYRGFSIETTPPGICVITFDRPDRLNGMRAPFKRDLLETLTQVAMDDAVRVVVFTGTGRAFSAGDDISHQDKGEQGEALVPEIHGGHDNVLGTINGLKKISQPINTAIRELDKLSIAAINGVAIQTGFSLALSCDFRVAARGARMGSATLRFGLLPDEGGHYLLLQMMGLPRALEFLMRKRIVDADEALTLNLVHQVVEPEDLMPAALALARELAEGPQVAMRLLKRSLYNAVEQTWHQALDDIASKTPIGDHHPDAKEGTSAFREKRQPRFNAWLEPSSNG
jgi:2-(1,2-epoxy-1,2-dihydrophenyl)acetyl-CoA isomerase